MRFRFPAGSTSRSLVAQLLVTGGWGQIVGPHGSGKSTLVAEIVRELRSRHRCVREYAVRPRERTRTAVQVARSAPRGSIVVVDGFDGLPRIARGALRLICRWRGAGLLVTTHRDAGLPQLWTTWGSLPLVRELVRQLVARQPSIIGDADIERAWNAAGGNVRETLFALYDIVERRGRITLPNPHAFAGSAGFPHRQAWTTKRDTSGQRGVFPQHAEKC